MRQIDNKYTHTLMCVPLCLHFEWQLFGPARYGISVICVCRLPFAFPATLTFSRTFQEESSTQKTQQNTHKVHKKQRTYIK